MAKKSEIDSVSLEILNHWTSDNFLKDRYRERKYEWGNNENCGTLVAFDWREDEGEYYLTEINTNVDLGELECEYFKFGIFLNFLKKHNYNAILGIRLKDEGPKKLWKDKLEDILDSNENLGWKVQLSKIDYDEYILEHWTSPIPEFSVTNTFILRYSYDAHNSVDQMASNQGYFETFMKKSDWSDYFRINPPYLKMNTFITEKRRVIILCSDVENLILGESFLK